MSRPALRRTVVAFLFFLATPLFAQAPPGVSEAARARIDTLVRERVTAMGVPSASIAIVQDGRVVYAQAYGQARINPPLPAAPSMRYGIGSISKQFTAAALLLLVEDRKLSLDDPVSKYLPQLTRAREVTIRQLLTHTAGYQDYYPQNYTPPMMRESVSPTQIMDLWARKPLDFDPGSKWEYSSTGYVIAGVIAEKVAGKPLFELLRQRIFSPLDMTSVVDVDRFDLGASDPQAYQRFALGPLRPTPKDGAGWLFAVGELGMTATDLAKWDIAFIDRARVLKPESFRAMEREALLTNGLSVGYGLGVTVGVVDGRRTIAHGGEITGFTAENVIFPDERAAIVVLVNQDALGGASGDIVRRISEVLFEQTDPQKPVRTERALQIFRGLQRGAIDRALFTENANSYFTSQALQDFAASLGPLGAPASFEETRTVLRGGMVGRRYSMTFPSRTLRVMAYEMPDGKLEQYQVVAE